MDDINKVMLMGRLVRAPKVYQPEGGEIFAIASMITREREENKQGETQEYTDYHALVCVQPNGKMKTALPTTPTISK